MVPRRTVLAAFSAIVAGCSTASTPESTTETTTATTATKTETTTTPPTTTTTSTQTETTASTPEPTCDARWNPTVQWSRDMETRVYQPTVADGVVYAGDQGGTGYAFDAASGDVLWKRSATVRFGSAPVVSGRTLTLVGNDRIAAYDTATGDERWTFAPPGEYAFVPPTHGSEDGTVFFGASQRPTPETDPDPVYDRVYALDRQTGDEIWWVSISDDDGDDDYGDWAVPEAVVVDAGRVFVSTEQRELVVLDADDGSVLWRRRFPGTTSHAERPVVAGGRVFQVVGGMGHVLDVETGTERWQATGEYPTAVAGATSYWVGHSTVVARDTASGAVRWRLRIPTEGCLRTPAVTDDVLYVPTGCGSTNATVHAIDATEGCWLGSFELESSNATTPVVSDHSVFVGGLNGAAKLWSLSAPGADDSS